MGGRRLCRCESVRGLACLQSQVSSLWPQAEPLLQIPPSERLLLVSPEDTSDEVQDNAQPCCGYPSYLECHPQSLSSWSGLSGVGRVLTFPGDSTVGEQTQWVWLNGEFRTRPWTLNESLATQSPPDSHEGDVSEPELGPPDSSAEEAEVT